MWKKLVIIPAVALALTPAACGGDASTAPSKTAESTPPASTASASSASSASTSVPASTTPASSTPASTVTASAAPPLIVDAKALGDEFDANGPAAEQRYNGKRVQLTAKISNITDGKLSFNGDTLSKIRSLPGISCNSLEDPNQVFSLVKGQDVTIVGTVVGQTPDGIINLRECSVVR